MRLKSSKLSKAVSMALVGGISLSAASGVVAQAEVPEAASQLATGSRLFREGDAEGVSPVLVINRDDIAATGLTSLADVVFQLTISDGSALRAVTTRTSASDGSQHASLRGVGSTRTLVLVNGRRWLTSGIAGNSLVDLDSIPVSIVERVEILKDGASAIYGSEAIAGVINVVTRQDYSVSEANLHIGRTEESDGEQQAFDVTVGERVNYGAGSITANYDGANKHRTVIEADVHVGSNCVLVAPVTIGAGGTVGGGSTVTESTAPGALTVARGKQVSIAGWKRPAKP